MNVLLDAHLSPGVCAMLNRTFSDLNFTSLFALGLLQASDLEVFKYAKNNPSILITKDKDFLALHKKFGCPPYILFLKKGNQTNAQTFESIRLVLENGLERIKIEGLIYV